MLVELMRPKQSAIHSQLREAAAERRRIESRIAELQSDPHLAEAVATYREAEKRFRRQAAERLQAHKLQCEADATELAKLARAKRTHPAALENERLRRESDRLSNNIRIACDAHDIAPQTLEGEL